MSDEFDSNQYWRDRHEKFRDNSQGVGNVSFTQEENDEVYQRARARMSSIVDVLGVAGFSSVLDLGCGIGKITPVFIERGMNYVGVDISEVAVELAAASNPKGSFLCEDISELSLEEQFALVLERTVFIHLVEDQKWRSALSVVKQHLATDGVFLVQDKIPEKDEVPAAHVLFRSVDRWREGLLDVGLTFDTILETKIREQLPNENIHPIVHA